ncbi:hypothetical protein SAPIO_CDS6556 [Scedosporium apiospermum]|uniref:Tyrosine specific protein phosphatases domain-containing protein n=1 Tax=Pseudallescheria apiosperma TaxID=563466 RepID=A0A084G3R7_PSEDA|nr:uncharacterized protein SAPIO_CDS6556 [Scedosporium apiospermum]KEZ41979.1 hypothetical protein SAPIO_CDS6556 [Scedosporium apiospermum]
MSATPLTTLLSIPLSQPLDPESLKPHLSSPPWHQIPGTFNFRSISHPPSVKENFIYRSGLLSSVSEEGKKEMVEVLGVRAVFDLRFNEERERDLEPELEGVEHFWLGIADVDRVAEGNDKWRTLEEMYFYFLTTHRPIFRDIFLHVLQKPDRPLLIHCTAGKDRTAVAVALLLSLAGVPEEVIAHDYALTRIGLEPVRDLLISKITRGLGDVDWENGPLKTLIGCEAATMLSFLRAMDEKFDGGVEGFVVSELGFNREEVEGIKKNLKGHGE